MIFNIILGGFFFLLIIIYFIWVFTPEDKSNINKLSNTKEKFVIKPLYDSDPTYQPKYPGYNTYVYFQRFCFTNDYGKTWYKLLKIKHPYKGFETEDFFFGERKNIERFEPLLKEEIYSRFPNIESCITHNKKESEIKKQEKEYKEEKKRLKEIKKQEKDKRIENNLKDKMW